jgi:hypothetical protein
MILKSAAFYMINISQQARLKFGGRAGPDLQGQKQ